MNALPADDIIMGIYQDLKKRSLFSCVHRRSLDVYGDVLIQWLSDIELFGDEKEEEQE